MEIGETSELLLTSYFAGAKTEAEGLWLCVLSGILWLVGGVARASSDAFKT